MFNPFRFLQRCILGFAAQLRARLMLWIGIKVENYYTFECYGSDGTLKWRESVVNLVTTEGLNDLLTKYFKGAAYTAAWYVGLVDNSGFTAFAAGDTAAQIGGSNGWAELTGYSEATRQALTLGTATAGSIDNSANKATFSINATVSIKGGFVASASAKNATTGVVYGEGAFSTVRSMINDDTLLVTVTATAATA